jgi:hypothetical protein
MEQHEAWRIAYRANRYLKDASITAIQQRNLDIELNLMDINDQGKIGVISSKFLWERYTHIHEELTLRNLPYSIVKSESTENFPLISYPKPPRGLRILGKNKILPREIVKIGKRQHIKDAMNYGRFRIAPASSYSDPSLNSAIQDDELSVTAIRSGDGATMRVIDPATGKAGEPEKAIGEVTYSQEMRENFYVLCMAARYSPRLLDDFEGDAILVINNLNRFIIRLESAVKKLHPELLLKAGTVKYYDPYLIWPDDDDFDPFFFKNFKYAYQKEFRFVWYAQNIPLDCQPFFVDIGQMRDIASIHVLRD